MELKQAKLAMLRKTIVTHNGIDYTVSACILRVRDKAPYYQLELSELLARSVTIADMDRVEIKGDGDA